MPCETAFLNTQKQLKTKDEVQINSPGVLMESALKPFEKEVVKQPCSELPAGPSQPGRK